MDNLGGLMVGAAMGVAVIAVAFGALIGVIGTLIFGN